VGKVSPERLLKLLQSDDLSKRRKALETLDSWGPIRALPHLLKLRREESSPELRELAIASLKESGAIIDLAPMGADTWFDQVKDSSPAFETLCDVLGERFVGYALIVGVQISGLTIDQFTPANTLVEFRLVESNPPRTLRLPDFRRELVNWILADGPGIDSASLPLDLAQAQQVVGVRYILLSPLHGLSLKEVILESPGRNPKASVVLTGSDGATEEVDVAVLRERLQREVQEELETARDEPFELDFKLVDQAEKAAKERDWDEVLRLIGHWPGPLSMLSRMQMGANLDEEKRGRIGSSLGFLAAAYRATGRSAWAEELYRLGLQFAGEGPAGGKLYRALGESMVEEKRFGEAIGPLRRALALGSSMATIGPSLGLALLKCHRIIAAAIVLERARREGANDQMVLASLKTAYAAMKDLSSTLRELHEDWTADEALAEAPLNDIGLDHSSIINASDNTIEIEVIENLDDEEDND
jgi:tetratricopeptide (TPR) repeat protein